jgi:magnesium-transporting ATPase (P-type)
MSILNPSEKEKILQKDIKKWKNMSNTEKKAKIQAATILNPKINQKDFIQSAKEELERCFVNDIEKEGIDMALINLHLKSTRDSILKNISESREEYDYLNENYEKILNRTTKIYVNDAKARKKRDELIEQKKIELLQEKIEEKEQKSSTIKIIILIVSFLVFGVFIVPLIIEHTLIFILICLVVSIIVSIINAIYVYFKKNLGD